MKIVNQSIGLLMGCAVVFNVGRALAQDWPQWRGPNGDAKVTGFNAPDKWPESLKEQWRTTVGVGDSSPALVGDRIYVFTRQGNEEVTQCLNAADGKEIWKNTYEAQGVQGPSARQHAGPRSSPAVADGKVVTVGVGGVVSCLNAADGKLLWRKDEFPKVVPRFYTATSPLIVDGLAIAYVGGQGKGALTAFDLANGDIKWKWAEEGPGYSSPALLTVDGSKQVVTLSEKSIVAVSSKDGKLLWRLPFEPTGMNYNAATPIVDGQTVIITGAGRGTRAYKVEKQGDEFVAKELWKNPMATQFNTPVLKDGYLYGLSDKENLFCINAKTGETAWTDTVRRGGKFAAIVDAGSLLLALPSNSELIAFKPDEKQYSEIGKVKVAGSATYAYPIVAGNRIFVKDNDGLALLTLN